MILLKRHLFAAPAVCTQLASLVFLARLRYGSVLVALPLCSSMCFFAFRFVLSVYGVAV
ncbi:MULTISPECIES: hypothetical protein [unclassified Caballeronia]|uniref:hypothetical protein n=1 Tax=unclassified Caballeronia TaxID=2646786 RepID=UPI002861EE99|nr:MULTISPECIES: hypothetical protein [unclassified Caballeronia]MDR5815275.1 hypothetical protein [Caballeronia sp. LZ033]MDR5822582.1 hypothetical protein [Caballeronia sp. LZ043]MDR5880004.1 hypothetical protein [Caballeronia sp. LZ032]